MVNDQTEAARDTKAIKLLKEQVQTLYQTYDNDPYVIPNTRAYLFDKPLLVMQQLLMDSLKCWILSVQEAIETREFWDKHTTTQHETFKTFFIVPPNGSLTRPKTVSQALHVAPHPAPKASAPAISSKPNPFYKEGPPENSLPHSTITRLCHPTTDVPATYAQLSPGSTYKPHHHNQRFAPLQLLFWYDEGIKTKSGTVPLERKPPRFSSVIQSQAAMPAKA